MVSTRTRARSDLSTKSVIRRNVQLKPSQVRLSIDISDEKLIVYQTDISVRCFIRSKGLISRKISFFLVAGGFSNSCTTSIQNCLA